MTNKSKRRFVAGAVCPTCKGQDTIMLYFENDIETIACVACDYSESQTDQQHISDAKRQNESVIGIFKPD